MTRRSVDAAQASPALHHVDFGGPPGAATVVCVHGLGGSHLNWDLLAPLLRARYRVLAVDLPGFGLSPPPRGPATVRRNVDALAGFLASCGGPVTLVGNSMGGLVAVLVAAGHPDLVRALALLDPALPAPGRLLRSPEALARVLAYAVPGGGEWLRRARRRRIGARATVEGTLRLCGIDPDTVPPALMARSVALVEHQDDVVGFDRAFLSASRSLTWAMARAHTYESAMTALQIPVLLVHGDRDGLVPVGAARTVARRHPDWRYVELKDVGHVPQLQAPDEVAGLLLPWLDEIGAAPPG
ncbi:alpha/beta fold hydrolase [Pseudonocardia sp. RS010]|uniref:alpha/beta fold hydrolase n=1 Tax=Pseudonocardia sp. RS010 TaxID=3385979 RepID=UPI00399F5B19